MANKTDSYPRLARALPYILIIGGIIGLFCSFVITNDKLQLAENPSFVPNCNLNPIISCGSVMASKQGSAFGFPNPWIGLSAFTVLVVAGIAILAGAKFKHWFWIGLESGLLLGSIFAGWLLFESIYRINALCPYCLSVDVVMLTTTWYVTLYTVREEYLPIPNRLIGVADFARRHHFEILFSAFLIVLAIILQHFWYYYGNYL